MRRQPARVELDAFKDPLTTGARSLGLGRDALEVEVYAADVFQDDNRHLLPGLPQPVHQARAAG